MTSQNPKISKDMSISEILEIVPDAVIHMKIYGLDCFGCEGGSHESLEKVMFEKNLKEKDLNNILERINKMKDELESRETQMPKDEDMKAIEIQEGNKKYFKLAGMMFTENAFSNLHNFATAKGLRIEVSTGGCSGFKYHYDFFDEPNEKEKIFRLSDKLEIFMNDFTFDKLHGSTVDFTIGLHGSGLKIVNPNVKRSCSCGTSVGF